MATPRLVVGVPVYGQANYLRPALASLLAQTHENLALVLVDDASPDDSATVAREIAKADPRVELHVNPRRLGMLRNTQRAWALSRERHSDAEYWALGSDHDVWHPRWAERLVGALDARREAVLAYPLTRRIDAEGRVVRGSFRFETRGVADPRARLRHAVACMVSGDMIYGVFRARALDAVGTYRPVLAPDRLLLSELALMGEFLQVPEQLWDRRFVGLASLERQRASFWPDGDVPWTARLPWWVLHTSIAAREHGAGLAARDYLPASLLFQLRSRAERAGSALAAPVVKGALRRPAVRRAAARAVLPALRETRTVVARLLDEAEAAAEAA